LYSKIIEFSFFIKYYFSQIIEICEKIKSIWLSVQMLFSYFKCLYFNSADSTIRGFEAADNSGCLF